MLADFFNDIRRKAAFDLDRAPDCFAPKADVKAVMAKVPAPITRPA